MIAPSEVRNNFGFRLLRALEAKGDTGNVIVSPFSIFQALAMTYDGAHGATRAAMAKTLGVDSTGPELASSNRGLLDALRKADPTVQIQIANALWLRKGIEVNPEFVALGKNSYEAQVSLLNFAADPNGAAETINSWVNTNTQGRIPSIVDELEPDTAVVLTDAVYFKGRWWDEFPPALTHPGEFFVPGSKSITAPMMERHGVCNYLETKDFQAVRLTYGYSQFGMEVFLPRSRDGLVKVVASLDQTHWA